LNPFQLWRRLFDFPTKDTLAIGILHDEEALVAVLEKLVSHIFVAFTGIDIDKTAVRKCGVVGILDNLATEKIRCNLIGVPLPGIPVETNMGLCIGHTLIDDNLFKKLGDVLVLCEHMLFLFDYSTKIGKIYDNPLDMAQGGQPQVTHPTFSVGADLSGACFIGRVGS